MTLKQNLVVAGNGVSGGSGKTDQAAEGEFDDRRDCVMYMVGWQVAHSM